MNTDLSVIMGQTFDNGFFSFHRLASLEQIVPVQAVHSPTRLVSHPHTNSNGLQVPNKGFAIGHLLIVA